MGELMNQVFAAGHTDPAVEEFIEADVDFSDTTHIAWVDKDISLRYAVMDDGHHWYRQYRGTYPVSDKWSNSYLRTLNRL